MQAEACIARLKFNLYIDGMAPQISSPKIDEMEQEQKLQEVRLYLLDQDWLLLLLLLNLQAKKVAARGAVSFIAGARRRDAPVDEHVEDGLSHSHEWRSRKSFSGEEGRGRVWPGWGHADGDQHKEEEQGEFGAEGRRLDKGGGHVMTVAARRKGRLKCGAMDGRAVQCIAVHCLEI